MRLVVDPHQSVAVPLLAGFLALLAGLQLNLARWVLYEEILFNIYEKRSRRKVRPDAAEYLPAAREAAADAYWSAIDENFRYHQFWGSLGGKRVPNADLRLRLVELCRIHDVEFHWVEGHAGTAGNERADTLSYAALRRDDLEVDDGYLRARELESVAPSKITVEGPPCRKCLTPVVKKRPKRSRKPGQEYYFEFYLFCPQCNTLYMVEVAKRYFDADQRPPPTIYESVAVKA